MIVFLFLTDFWLFWPAVFFSVFLSTPCCVHGFYALLAVFYFGAKSVVFVRWFAFGFFLCAFNFGGVFYRNFYIFALFCTRFISVFPSLRKTGGAHVEVA